MGISSDNQSVSNSIQLIKAERQDSLDDTSTSSSMAVLSKPIPTPTARPSLLDRLSFTKSKGLYQLLADDQEHLKQEEQAKGKSKIQAQHAAEATLAEETRKADDIRVKKYNKNKKRREEQEKRNEASWGGIVRGFDPNAGLIRTSQSPATASSESTQEVPPSELSLAATLNPKLERGQTWGIEYGNVGGKGSQIHFPANTNGAYCDYMFR
jgi:hypothetical protein